MLNPFFTPAFLPSEKDLYKCINPNQFECLKIYLISKNKTMMVQPDACFVSYEAFLITLNSVIYYIKGKFPRISLCEIEEIASEAIFVTHQFQQTNRLMIPVLAMARRIARNKAIDVTRRKSVICSLSDAASHVYTDNDGYDDEWQFLIDQTRVFIRKQSQETQLVFDASGDSVLEKLTDVELAQHLNFKVQTDTSVRAKRARLKRNLTEYLLPTPQYQAVNRRYQQVA